VLLPTKRGWERKFGNVEFQDVQMKQLADWTDVLSAIGPVKGMNFTEG
jgi:hypothetical protein